MGAPESVSFYAHSSGTSDEPSRERAGRVSLLGYSPALVAVLIAVVDSSRYADPDLWGHIKFGQAVLAQHRLILHDPYSYSAPGHLWLNHEWLAEVILAAVYNVFGIVGLKLMKLGCSAATIVLLAIGTAETGAPAWLQFAAPMAAAVPITPQIEFRPQAFTFALLSALFALLARDNYRRDARLWLAIPLLALWANLHGGFIMGLATLGVYSAAVIAQDLAQGNGTRRGVRLLTIAAAATLATLATPYGVGTWQAVLHALGNPYTRIYIHDWRSLATTFAIIWNTDWLDIYFIVIPLVMFATLALAWIATPRGGDFPLAFVAAVMIGAAFVAVRNLTIALIATTIPLARHLALAIDARRARRGLLPMRTQVAMRSSNQVIVAAAGIVLLLYSGLFSPKLPGGAIAYPRGAVEMMKQRGLSGNILTDFGWGEYVIWHLCPPSKVFIDGRYDTVYPMQVIEDNLLVQHHSTERMGEVLGKYPHDFVLLDPNDDQDEYRTMLARPDWKRIYLDGTSALFARAGTPAASIEPVTRSAAGTPTAYFP
jgi:hypothetical protein